MQIGYRPSRPPRGLELLAPRTKELNELEAPLLPVWKMPIGSFSFAAPSDPLAMKCCGEGGQRGLPENRLASLDCRLGRLTQKRSKSQRLCLSWSCSPKSASTDSLPNYSKPIESATTALRPTRSAAAKQWIRILNDIPWDSRRNWRATGDSPRDKVPIRPQKFQRS